MYLSSKSLGDVIYRDSYDESSVFNEISDTINYTIEMSLYAPSSLTDSDGNAYSSTNLMNLDQLPT